MTALIVTFKGLVMVMVSMTVIGAILPSDNLLIDAMKRQVLINIVLISYCNLAILSSK